MLQYVEDFRRHPSAEIGPKDIFEIAFYPDSVSIRIRGSLRAKQRDNLPSSGFIASDLAEHFEVEKNVRADGHIEKRWSNNRAKVYWIRVLLSITQLFRNTMLSEVSQKIGKGFVLKVSRIFTIPGNPNAKGIGMEK